ncbi:hypothetical protein [Nocardioides perillae]|uniref:Small secreted protein n=1 Tax=Nocardioides perillae TaxID=1119534 RepID=A0A7Y9RW90_9ACTN|nr:hypothetical protein [Nocardioides perillae]NYG55968.1 hypothetical protein [Nocardioides perillae]
MKRNLALSASAVLLAGVLAGCGGDDGGSSAEGSGGSGGGATDDYCAALEQAKEDIDALEQGDVAQFEQTFQVIGELAEQAPDEVAADWRVLDETLTGLETSLADAGLELADLEQLSAGEVPEGVDMAKLQQLATEMQSFSSAEVEEAGDAISEHAQSECGIDLDDSGASEGAEPSDGASE